MQQYLRSARALIGFGAEAVEILGGYHLGLDGKPREGFRMVFQCVKNQLSNKLPNSLTLDIYNLSKSTRDRITKHATSIQFDVGYNGVLTNLFTGQLAHHIPTHEGTDWLSTMYCWDQYIVLRESQVTISLNAGDTVRNALNAVIAHFGPAGANFQSIGIEYLDQTFLLSSLQRSGSARDAMDRLGEDFGFGWGFLDGRLEVWGDKAVFPDKVIEISASTGMIGSPIVTDLGVEVTTLLNPAVRPRRQIVVKSVGAGVRVGGIEIRKEIPTLAQGTYTVGEVVFDGDTRSNDWYSRIKTFRQDTLAR